MTAGSHPYNSPSLPSSSKISSPAYSSVEHKSSSSSLKDRSAVSNVPLTASSSRPATPTVVKPVVKGPVGRAMPVPPAAIAGISGPISATSANTTEDNDDQMWRSVEARRAEREWRRQSEKGLSSDPRYKKYTALIDRALISFDSVAEWADFVGALGRLEKIFSAPPPVPTSIIPRSLLLSKRLSQCLNPALPSGVHHRALSVYRQLFLLLSVDGLRRDLSIWTPGLLPFFERANTSTRPVVLALLEDFYLPLKEDLKPASKALLLAVLPGLEEEGAENFDRTLHFLDSLHRCIGDGLFWDALWGSMISNANVRQAAINLLVKRPPPTVTGDSSSVAYRLASSSFAIAISSLLDSSDILIIRGGLDMLSQHLHLNSMLWKLIPIRLQIRVMKSAVSILLRKELSLNRRLWGWLCGTTAGPTHDLSLEEEKKEATYFEIHGLAVLKQGLLEDMVALGPMPATCSHNAADDDVSARQRPYRIFLSLLDKWAVAASLTSVLALDALNAFQWQAGHLLKAASTLSPASELLNTVGMLFDAFDKDILTSRLIAGLQGELLQGSQKNPGQISRSSSPSGSDIQANDRMSTMTVVDSGAPPTSLLDFVLTHFSFKDDVSKRVHVPNLATALLALSCKAVELTPPPIESLARSLDLCRVLISNIEINYMLHTTEVYQETTVQRPESPPPGVIFDSIEQFYDSSSDGDDRKNRAPLDYQSPLVQSQLLQLGLEVSEAVLRGNTVLETLISASSRLLLALLNRIDNAVVNVARTSWEPQAWLQAVTHRISLNTIAFTELESLVRTVLAGSQCNALVRRICFVHYVSKPTDFSALLIINRLVDAMQSSRRPDHQISAVELLWEVVNASEEGLLSGYLSAGLLSPCSSLAFNHALEGLGTLWRLSDDDRLVSGALTSPVRRLLNMLCSEQFDRRQAAETWLRSNLRSYSPLLILLCSPIPSAEVHTSMTIASEKTCSNGVMVKVFNYTGPMDQGVLNYTLTILLAVSRYGAMGFIRGARSSVVTGSSPPRSYLDEIIDVTLRLLQGEGYCGQSPPHLFAALNASTHSICVDLLQTLAARGGVAQERLDEVESRLIDRLLLSISNGQVHEHHKLLLALHTIILSRSSQKSAPLSPHPLLLRTILAALDYGSALDSLPHWTDFILMTVTAYRRSLEGFLIPLIEGLCVQLRKRDEFKEAEMLLLINALEKVALLSSSEGKLATSADRGEHESPGDAIYHSPSITLPPPVATPKSGTGGTSTGADDGARLQNQQAWRLEDQPSAGSSILGYVSGMFGGDAQQGAGHGPGGTTTAQTMSMTLTSLQLTVTTLHDIWVGYPVLSKVKARASRMLERVYKSYPGPVAEMLVDCWRSIDTEQAGPRPTSLQLFDHLLPSPQIVVTFLCDTLSNRLPVPGSSRSIWASDQVVSADVLLEFLQTYLIEMPSDAAPGVWPVVLMLAKDLLANSAAHKGYLFPAFQCMTILGDHLMSINTWVEDKKARRDLQDTYLRLFDLCVLVAGRAGRDLGGDGLDEKPGTSSSLPTSQVIVTYLARNGLPTLRRIASVDADRVATSASNAVYYIIAPPLRTKGRSYEGALTPAVLSLAVEISKVTGARRALRSCLQDAFLDPRFFRMSAETGKSWCRPVMMALYSQDKTSFLELLARVTTTTSTNINIFANRRAEQVVKALHLRRVSFVLYASERDQFLPQLPAILERLVEVLKGGVEIGGGGGGGSANGSTSELLRAEAYLCLRVMLCRLDSQHLMTLWPLLITDLMRLFESTIEDLPSNEDSDSLQVILGACKFLDLLFTLQTSEFQIHQWIFVSDVAQAGDDWLEEPLLPQLASVIEERMGRTVPVSRHSDKVTAGMPCHHDSDTLHRRPLLLGQRELSSLVPLIPVLRGLRSTGGSQGDGSKVAWQDIESDLARDMFEDSR